jgi:hemoglobin
MSQQSQISLYDQLGGEAGVHRLVHLFYDHMDTSVAATHIRSLHQSDLSDSRQKLFEYFSGWFGGPPLFVEKHGHPRLRARHNHVAIGLADRDAWLACLYLAMNEMNLSESLHQDLVEKIAPMADHMRNNADEAPLADC